MRATVFVGVSAVVAALIVISGWFAPENSADRGAHPTPGVTLERAPRAAAGQVRANELTPLTVLLMGDSYTAGNGARTPDGQAAYYGPAKCLQSTATWGEQYADAMASQGYAVTLLNRACSAASTDAVLNDRYLKDSSVVTYPEPELSGSPREDAVYDAWARGDARCAPTPASDEYIVTDIIRTPAGDGTSTVHVTCEHWLPPQVDALNPDVDLVFLTLGGNDVHFPDIVRACLILGDADECEQALDVADAYVANDFSADLIDVFVEIHRRTAGHARVVYLAYPNLEVNDDLELTSMGIDGMKRIPVAQRLDALADAGLDAQRRAVEAANAYAQSDAVVFLDAIPDLFAGHEPDARPASVNEDRWMYEAFETLNRDEWYHLKPEGHRQIAKYVSGFGDFGAAPASEDRAPARDVALVIGDRGMAHAAVAEALTDESLWTGASIAIIEQQLAADGTNLERRVVVEGANSRQAVNALADRDRPAWRPATDVVLPARWNATAHVVYVGDASLSLSEIAPVWSGDAQGRIAYVDWETVDVAPLRVASPGIANYRIDQALADVRARLEKALAEVQASPLAWAGGPYIATGTSAALNAQGSYQAATAAASSTNQASTNQTSTNQGPTVATRSDLTFEWDLDADGIFETRAPGPQLDIGPGELTPGWIAVRVTTPAGHASIAPAWVASVPVSAEAGASCRGDDAGATTSGGHGRVGCGTEQPLAAGPEGEPVPNLENSLRSASGDGYGSLEAPPLYIDERVRASSGGRSRSGARPGRARERVRIYLRRELSLLALLTVPTAPRRIVETNAYDDQIRTRWSGSSHSASL